jgi:exopolysaccharide production protein ExoZ
VNSSQGNQADLVKSFLLWPSGRLPLVMVAWSLIHELWFYIVFAVILRFNERLLLPFLLLWGAVVITVNTFVTTAGLWPGIRIALHPYSLEFVVGALVALFVYRGRTDMFSSCKAFLIVMLAVSAGLYFVYAHDLLNDASLVRVGIIGILYGLLVLSFAASEKAGRMATPRSMQFLGNISYTVYLSHTLVLSAIGRMWMMINPVPDRLYDNLLAFLIMVAAVIGYGWVGYRLVEQPALAVSHRLRTRWFDTDYGGTPVPTVTTDPQSCTARVVRTSFGSRAAIIPARRICKPGNSYRNNTKPNRICRYVWLEHRK